MQLPTERLYSAHVFEELDIGAMQNSLAYLKGTHDFSSFEGAGSRNLELSGRGAVRTILGASLETLGDGRKHRFTITGDGFLRYMVRNIVGTMFGLEHTRLHQG